MEEMKFEIPWWGKVCAKLVLSRLPFGYSVWRRLGLFRHGDMDTSEYAIRVFNSHLEKSGLRNQLAGKTVLELGPGDSIASAIIAAAHGARAIIVDEGRFVHENIIPYLDLESALTKKGLSPTDLSGCRDIEEILNRCSAKYMTEGLESLRKIEDATVDLIFSQAVLEHVRRQQFSETMRECRRILRPDGICSHQVDLRDHLARALNNLRFSERVWESEFFAKSGFYTNRIRHRQMLDLFAQVGFTVECSRVRCWDAMPTPRAKLAEEFRVLPDDDLLVSVFDVVLRKKR